MWLMQTMKNSQLIHNGCMKLIILYFMWQEKKRVGGFHSTKLIREHTVIVQSFHNSVWNFLAFCRFQDISGKKVTGTEQNRTFLLLEVSKSGSNVFWRLIQEDDSAININIKVHVQKVLVSLHWGQRSRFQEEVLHLVCYLGACDFIYPKVLFRKYED